MGGGVDEKGGGGWYDSPHTPTYIVDKDNPPHTHLYYWQREIIPL